MYKDYTIGQTQLVLSLPFTVRENHIAVKINDFVDSIPKKILLGNTSKTGRPAYHPAMMLKILLYAYSCKVFSGREIERMLEENIPMIWLAQQQTISYHTINNFRASEHMSQLLRHSFLQFTEQLMEKNLLNRNSLFIDGTKLEADANKYSFVWRKATQKFEKRMHDNLGVLYQELVEKEVVREMALEEVCTPEGIDQLIEDTSRKIEELNQKIEEEPKTIPGGSKNKKERRTYKKYLRKLQKDYRVRAIKYENYNQTCNNRNSFSKTDTDATFMRMKEDPMLNGQLKPGYNLQIATCNQYIIDYQLFPNPTDTKTLIPFLKHIQCIDYFDNIVADAGYGSQENYAFLENELKKNYYIPYNTYLKEQTRKFKQDPSKRENGKFNDEEASFTDGYGVKYQYVFPSQKIDRSGFVRNFLVYEALEKQSTPELTQLSKTPSGFQKRIRRNLELEKLKAHAREKLSSEEGREIFRLRKIDVEPTFGHLKGNFRMRRVHLRGQEKVTNDIGLMLLAMNLKKYQARVGV